MKKIILYIATVIVASLATGATNTYASQPGAFPSLHIYIDDGESPFIYRQLWLGATFTLQHHNNDFSFNDVSGRTRGRGNSTWYQGEQKRPLRLRFDEPISLVGSNYKATDWILLANHFDDSLLRNHFALYFASQLSGLGFTPSSTFLHLYVNGAYMGVYQLTDERDINDGRMYIEHNSDPALSGFFLRLNSSIHETGTQNVDFVSLNNKLYEIRFPSSNRQRTPAHMQYIYDYLAMLNYAIRNLPFSQIQNIIDISSFIDFYIVQELTNDPDGIARDTFISINGVGDERRLFMGPVWDFDGAIGNSTNLALTGTTYGLYIGVFHEWYRYLLDRPEFFQLVTNRLNEIQPIITYTINHLQDKAHAYTADFARNFDRHPRANRNAYEIFFSNVNFVTDWLTQRNSWLLAYFNGLLTDYDPWQTVLAHFNSPQGRIHMTLGYEPLHFYSWPILLNKATLVHINEIERIFPMANIEHNLGAQYFTINGVSHQLMLPTNALGGQLFLPIRVVAEAVGYSVDWDEASETVTLQPN